MRRATATRPLIVGTRLPSGTRCGPRSPRGTPPPGPRSPSPCTRRAPGACRGTRSRSSSRSARAWALLTFRTHPRAKMPPPPLPKARPSRSCGCTPTCPPSNPPSRPPCPPAPAPPPPAPRRSAAAPAAAAAADGPEGHEITLMIVKKALEALVRPPNVDGGVALRGGGADGEDPRTTSAVRSVPDGPAHGGVCWRPRMDLFPAEEKPSGALIAGSPHHPFAPGHCASSFAPSAPLHSPRNASPPLPTTQFHGRMREAIPL